MTLQRSTLLLPCHSLDDFPTFLSGQDATSLLSTWTVLWHPELIAASGQVPAWQRADDPPDPLAAADQLIVVPRTAASSLPTGWIERLLSSVPANPPPILEVTTRREMISMMREAGTLREDKTDSHLVADFFALGYAYLQIELLTRAMSCSDILDAEAFREVVVVGARAAVQGDEPGAHSHLQRAFDLITQTRQHYYPVDFFVVDVTLLADSTFGEPLRAEIEAGQCMNLLATGAQIHSLMQSAPTSCDALRAAAGQSRTCVVGGQYGDVRLATAPPELVLEDLTRGLDTYRHYLGQEVNVFGQFTADRSPLLPQTLASFGFVGGLLTTFDGSQLPHAEQTKSHWQGADGQSIDALVVPPYDAGQDETFLALTEYIADSMQHDHVATLLLAGWPGHRSPFYEDFCRTFRYGPVLGRRVSLADYFTTSANGNVWSVCKVSPNAGSDLARDIRGQVANPISARASQFREITVRTYDHLLHGLSSVVAGSSTAGAAARATVDVDRLRDAILGDSGSEGPADRLFAVNAWSFPRQISLPNPHLPHSPSRVAQIPGCGYVCEPPQLPSPPIRLAENGCLRNEFCEVQISQLSGGIASLKTYRDRTNRMSQRLVHCHGRSSGTEPPLENGTRMLAESVEVTQSDDLCGEITARGKLLDESGQTLARFVQRHTLRRGDPCLHIEVTLHDVLPPCGNPWTSYVASRLLWSQAGGQLYHGASWIRQPASHSRLIAPDWIEIEEQAAPSPRSITLIPRGLHFHKRVGDQGIDTLLVVAGETMPAYEFALCLDRRYPTQQSLGMLTPTDRSVTKVVRGGMPATGWLLHVSARNVIVTALEPLGTTPAGLRMRILETEGRAASVQVSAFRPFVSGIQTDFGGQTLDPLLVEEGRLIVHVGAFEWLQLEGRWEPEECES